MNLRHQKYIKENRTKESMLTDLQFEVMKKAMDPKIEERTSLSLDLHTAFILHSALLYRKEDNDYYVNYNCNPQVFKNLHELINKEMKNH